MPGQTYASLTDAQRSFYEMTLLERALPYTPLLSDAERTTVPEHQGKVAEWRVWGGSTVGTDGAGLPLATTALTEGTPPAASTVSVAKLSATVLQYGAYVQLTDLAVHQLIDPIWTESYEILGEQAGGTIHTVFVQNLVTTGGTGTAVQYAGAATSRNTVAAGMIMSSAEIREAVRTLRRQKVPTFPDGFYHGFMHPDVEYDMMNDADWKAMSTYNGGTAAGSNGFIKSAIGDYLGVRWTVSTDAPVFTDAGAGGTVEVYGTFIYGPRWMGYATLAAQPTPKINPKDQRGIKVFGVPVEQETKDDPLGQYGVAGWKTSFVGTVLQKWRGVRVESAATV